MQAIRGWPFPEMTVASGPLTVWFLCTTVPILAYANFTKPFKLDTDACRSGLGAVFYQTDDARTNPIIAYASGSLTKAETHSHP